MQRQLSRLLPLLATVLLAPLPLWSHGGGLDTYGCHHKRVPVCSHYLPPASTVMALGEVKIQDMRRPFEGVVPCPNVQDTPSKVGSLPQRQLFHCADPSFASPTSATPPIMAEQPLSSQALREAAHAFGGATPLATTPARRSRAGLPGAGLGPAASCPALERTPPGLPFRTQAQLGPKTPC